VKRMHLHVGVADLDSAIDFYSTLFAAPPTVRKADYAKWLLEDPSVNFAISRRDGVPGLRHLGIQVEDQAELREVQARLDTADAAVLDEGHTTCCYARSEKSWASDPAGLRWEVFHTYGEASVYGDGVDAPTQAASATKCCAPAAAE
jgi:catechol 2,3-dioxygenase-like lactoylglutathione lyase family enzyme